MPEDRPIQYIIKENDEKIDVLRIKSIFNKKINMRKVFILIVKNEPAFTHNISNGVIGMTHSTIYNYINDLMNLNIIKRQKVHGVDPKTWVEKESLKKFLIWSQSMPQKTKDYYQSRTGLYYVTGFGEQFIEWVCEIEGIKFKKIKEMKLNEFG